MDALRFLAVTASFLHHQKIWDFIHGHTFFFLLAAFILTRLAFKEYLVTYKFSWINFTIRRLLRIAPPYLLVLLICFVIVPLIAPKEVQLPNPAWYLTYTANYCSTPHIFALTILWAISVQEQFYLFISTCYKFLYKYLFQVALVMILVSIVYKSMAISMGWGMYFHTLNHFSSFGCGILLAIGTKQGWFERLYRMPKVLNICLYAVIGLLFYNSNKLYAFSSWYIADNVVMSLAFSYIVLETSFFTNKFVDLNKTVRLHYLGRISYGLYCYQGLVITAGGIFFSSLSLPWLTLANYIALILVAHFSYQLVERKFLLLKPRFRTYSSDERA